MNLRGRVDALYDRLRPHRLVIVMPGDGRPPVAPMEAGCGLVLHVAGEEYESDPRAGLGDVQRHLIGADDQLVIVKYEDQSIEDQQGESDDAGPDRAA